ncbi:hypothetical protein [Halegenticoccus tardaugens]|uniref:hypothetical protein n=1 Tax=Halegenticoccus tardaugens TaxID=2071624 RepID=UPI00100C061F|nr:hypothetical protein [Halegenticoccus tardaugens]
MADVTTARRDAGGDRRDRAQFFAVAGLTLAIVFVVLVLLLNTAIFTQNLATRSAGSDGGEAIEFRATVVDAVGEVVEAENRRPHGDYAGVDDAVEAGIGEIDNRTSARFAGRGVAVGVENGSVATTAGTLVYQDEDGEFVYDDGEEETDWTLVEDADETRAFTLDFDADDLSETSAPEDDAFRVAFDDGGDERYVYAYRDGDDVVVAAADDPDAPPGDPVCAVEPNGDGAVTLDLTGERLVGADDADCDGLWPSMSGYDVRYERGDEAAGRYELTVAGEEGDRVAFDDEADAGVDAVPAAYDATVPVRYESADVRFETTVRVAPGEPDA